MVENVTVRLSTRFSSSAGFQEFKADHLHICACVCVCVLIAGDIEPSLESGL